MLLHARRIQPGFEPPSQRAPQAVNDQHILTGKKQKNRQSHKMLQKDCVNITEKGPQY